MSVPTNATMSRLKPLAPKYKKRADFRARRRGFQNALHEFMFYQLIAINKAKAQVNA